MKRDFMTHDTRIRDTFGFTPNDDFHLFWEFARATNPENPRLAFGETAMIRLAGPFDVLAGRFDTETAHFAPCLHWRYFGDPPSFVTTLVGGSDGLHWGYVVERPDDQPLGIAGYYAHDDVTFFQESPSLFGVLWNFTDNAADDMEADLEEHPELVDDEETREHIAACRTLLDSIDEFCTKHGVDGSDIDKLTFIEHCNPPAPFPFPEPDEFDKLPELIAGGIERLVETQGFSEFDARLKVGRMLWHWHHDGNPILEQAAFELLDAAYATEQKDFLRHVLSEHRQHRHRESLDVFEK